MRQQIARQIAPVYTCCFGNENVLPARKRLYKTPQTIPGSMHAMRKRGLLSRDQTGIEEITSFSDEIP